MLSMKILMENKTYRDGFGAEHGLALYLETEGMTILYDTGASDLLVRNAAKMNVDLDQVDVVVISHGHYDHTGGIPAFADINEHAPIYIHEEAFHTFYGLENGELEEDTCGIRWTSEERNRIESRLSLTRGPHWLSPNIVISGTIPVDSSFVPAEQFYYKTEDGLLHEDSMAHEQFLAICDKMGGGIHLFSGCTHTGIFSAIRYAKELFPGERIATITAGLHLYNTTAIERQPYISRLVDEQVNRLIPVHCTGMGAICDLKTALGDQCQLMGVGDSIQLG